MDTMWQRFGRVARGPGTEGVAILFAEDKYFDDAKEKARLAAEAKKQAQEEKARNIEKRKHEQAQAARQRRPQSADDQSPTEAFLPASNNHRNGPENSSVDAAPAQHMSTDPNTSASSSSLSVHDMLRIEYTQAQIEIDARTKRGKEKEVDGTTLAVSPEMDSFINAATRTFACYRVPINAYYQNDRRGA